MRPGLKFKVENATTTQTLNFISIPLSFITLVVVSYLTQRPGGNKGSKVATA